ncbi:hypothetical protein LHK_01943 [Laribacter hongkongensis HLHK9]|uniref:Uncharacterized protein n=4 Tax=Laribacter hongkongensis TaxID=168471 RepID=C1D8Y7_LARHH|nr:hypothetical protein LHK_01943 [Laribacter hongkongensis HLHK9]
MKITCRYFAPVLIGWVLVKNL